MGQGGRQFDQLFVRFGYRAGRTIGLERTGVRFQIPAAKDSAAVGYYSAFALAGDFEVRADFEVVAIPRPTTGYGASFGLTVDSDGPAGAVSLVRGHWPDGKEQVAVVRATPA